MKIILSFVAATMTLCASAEVKTWVGGTDTAWSTEANWEGGVPGEGDTAVFTNSVTADVGTAFGGTIYVTNATVTVNVTGEVTMNAKIENNGTLKKTGEGVLTLLPTPGSYKGAIYINEGGAVFKKCEEPAMFGKLFVAEGASVSVADSPAENRHGMLLKYSTIPAEYAHDYTPYETYYKLIARTFDKWNSTWSTGTVDVVGWTSTTDYGKPVGSPVAAWFLPGYTWAGKQNTFMQGRAIAVLSPRSKLPTQSTALTETNYKITRFGCLYVDGVQKINHCTVYNNVDAIANIVSECGLHDLALDFMNKNADPCNMELHFYSNKNKNGYLYPDTLWNGVCFNGLELAANATISIADNQAVAFATVDKDKIEGSIIGGTGTYFSLLAGQVTLPKESLSAFSGIVEVGRNATIVPSSASGDTKYDGTVICYGTIAVKNQMTWEFLDDGVGGFFDVEAGSTLKVTGSAASGTSCDEATGSGSLILDGLPTGHEVDLQFFNGEVSALNGVRKFLDIDQEDTQKTIELGDQSVLAVSSSQFGNPWTTQCVEVNGFSANCWATNGVQGAPIIEDNGNMLMTYKYGKGQRTAACLTNVAVMLDEAWEASFSYKLKYHEAGDTTLEGIAFTMQPNGDIGHSTQAQITDHYNYRISSVGIMPKSEGFRFATYIYSDNRGTPFALNNASESRPFHKSSKYTTSDINGITLWNVDAAPVDVKVAYDGKRQMTIELKQNGKTFVGTNEIVVLPSRRSQPYYLTFSAGASWAGCYHMVSNFSARIYKKVGTETTLRDEIAFNEENWQINTNQHGSITLSENALTFPKGGSVICSAYLKKPLRYTQAWTASFMHSVIDKKNGTADTFAMTMRSVTNNVNYSENRGVGGSMPGSYGLGFRHYNNICQAIMNGNGGAYFPSSLKIGGDYGTGPMNNPSRVTVTYNGNGLMRYDVVQTSTSTRQTWFVDISKDCKGDETFFFGFSYASAGWDCFAQNEITDFTFSTYDAKDEVNVSAMNVKAESEATFAVGGSDEQAVNVPSIALESGSTLNVTNCNDWQASYRLNVEELRFPQGGVGTLTSVAGTTVLDRLVFSGDRPSRSALAGKFAAKGGSLEVVVPKAWVDFAPAELVDVSQVTWEGGAQPALTLVDEDGKPLNVLRVIISNGVLKLYKAGMVIIMR